jgi:hypothetical protein
MLILAQISQQMYLNKHFRIQNCCFLLLGQLCEWHMDDFLLNNHNYFSFTFYTIFMIIYSLNYLWDVSPALLIFPKI